MTPFEQWMGLLDRWKMTHFGEALLHLHRCYEGREDGWWCAGCDHHWPCPTIQHCMKSVNLTMEDLK